MSLVLEKWADLTEGPRGISSIPAPSRIDLFGWGQIEFDSNVAKYYLSLAALALCMLFVWRLVHSPLGRAFESIRQNELLASDKRRAGPRRQGVGQRLLPVPGHDGLLVLPR